MKHIFTFLFLFHFSPFTFSQSSFVVPPYLQYATPHSIRIHWETSEAATTLVQYGAAKPNSGKAVWDATVSVPGKTTMHHATLTNLQPETVYFYRAVSILAKGDSLISDINTFQTAVKDSSAFAFAVFSDSQNDWKDPEAWKRVSTQAFKERPNFAVHAGDLVDLGYMKDDWVNEFFAQSNLFMKTIPIFSIAGNHEHDAAYYYQYMYVPQPYFYSFKYGNAEFFMVDTDQYQEEGTELYNKVEQALAASDAYWKFVVHHHPPYSSDDDDFGDTRYEASERGDKEVQSLVPLYEKYGVDIVFYGHIHTYERTWPIMENKPVQENGVLYLNMGGAGGSLENAAPTRSWFTNKVKTIHHFGYIAIHQNKLEFQAIDENGMVFDRFTLTGSRKNKIPAATPAAPVVKTRQRIFTDTLQLLLTTPGNAEIRFTLNGAEPTKNSPVFRQAITINKTTTLKTAAFNKTGKSRTNTYQFTKEKMHDAVALSSPQPGLRYQYFTSPKIKDEDSVKFQSLSVEKEGIVQDLDLSHIPHQPQYWGAVYNGYIKVPADGYYRFDGHADHILRLHIHNKMLFEELDREINYEGEIYLKAGYHPVKIEYYNSRVNRAFLELYYTGPGIQRQSILANLWWYQ
ncbi:MAG: metallophosphoesterase [Agriterribacter sp.]